jgi:hypothetical protein
MKTAEFTKTSVPKILNMVGPNIHVSMIRKICSEDSEYEAFLVVKMYR